MNKQQAQIAAIDKKFDLLLRAPTTHNKHNKSGGNKNGIPVCYGCGSPDHMVRQCPAKKSANQKKQDGQRLRQAGK